MHLVRCQARGKNKPGRNGADWRGSAHIISSPCANKPFLSPPPSAVPGVKYPLFQPQISLQRNMAQHAGSAAEEVYTV